jgi:HemY protein
MKSLLWILALFALAVGVSLVMRVNEGYVLLVLPPSYRVELSLNLAALAAALAFGALYALLRAIALASSLPRRLRESRARRKQEKAAQTFAEGVRLYLAGESKKAIAALAGLRGKGDWAELAEALSARMGGTANEARETAQASASPPEAQEAQTREAQSQEAQTQEAQTQEAQTQETQEKQEGPARPGAPDAP